MNKIITILFLILHVNTSMFIPVMDEFDMFDVHGAVVDDVNNAYELVDQVILGHKDKTKDTDSEEHEHYFNAAQVKAFVAPVPLIAYIAQEPVLIRKEKPDYLFRPEDKWASIAHEITVPPPKA